MKLRRYAGTQKKIIPADGAAEVGVYVGPEGFNVGLIVGLAVGFEVVVVGIAVGFAVGC